MKTFHIITIFPQMFDSYLGESILKRAIEDKKIKVEFYNPRDVTLDKHKKVDDKPYGGGPGMVMMAQPIIDCVRVIKSKVQDARCKVFITSAGGEKFTNETAQRLAQEEDEDLVIICGRYEGIDSRVKEVLGATEISVGDYVLTGGELPSMIMIDAIARQIPGVLGKEDSIEENRISSHEMYTRPEVFEHEGKEYKVPEVLMSGNHKEIDEYRSKNKK